MRCDKAVLLSGDSEKGDFFYFALTFYTLPAGCYDMFSHCCKHYERNGRSRINLQMKDGFQIYLSANWIYLNANWIYLKPSGTAHY